MKSNQSDENQHRSLVVGDSVYFSDGAGQAQHGTVAGIGKHGATIDVEGEDGKTTEHRVHHARIIGHRHRAERKLVIVDRGEDGGIAVDETGKRIFLRGQIDPDGDPMSKALTGNTETAEDGRTLSMVNAALSPVLTAMHAMQTQHQQSLEQFGRLVEAAIGKPLPTIEVRMPEQQPANVHVSLPEQPAPIINVAAPELPAPVINVQVPARKTITEIERNKDGDIIRAVQKEQE